MNPSTTPLAAGLYLIATPIGNARDITLRALDALQVANVLAAEDTRTLRKLMEIHGVSVGDRPLIAYHDHSNDAARVRLLEHIRAGRSVAYVSEAGTPLVADPGYKLAQEAGEAGLKVEALPGASAMLAAISVSGLPSDRFTFAGFAPTTEGARKRFLEAFGSEAGTTIFYESPKRLAKFLTTAAAVFGGDRRAAVCRELTKKFEQVRRGTLGELLDDPGTLKGEIVVVIGPAVGKVEVDQTRIDQALLQAMETLSVKDAAAEVAEVFGLKKRDLYQRALEIK